MKSKIKCETTGFHLQLDERGRSFRDFSVNRRDLHAVWARAASPIKRFDHARSRRVAGRRTEMRNRVSARRGLVRPRSRRAHNVDRPFPLGKTGYRPRRKRSLLMLLVYCLWL